MGAQNVGTIHSLVGQFIVAVLICDIFCLRHRVAVEPFQIHTNRLKLFPF